MTIESIDTAKRSAPYNRASDCDRANDRALEEAFEAYWLPVCRILYRLLGDWDEAEEQALEVFCRLHRRPPRDRDRLVSWLYRVATRAGLNALRARTRRRRYEQEAGVLRLQQASLDPADEVERRDRGHRVRRVLAELRPRQAQLLILRHSGLSYAELAAVLKLAPGSVGTMLARAERAFERRYRAMEGDEP
jgi:RNA polymerase sigma-70 factor (ECF subfamily)